MKQVRSGITHLVCSYGNGSKCIANRLTLFAAEERHLHYLSSAPTGAHTDSLCDAGNTHHQAAWFFSPFILCLHETVQQSKLPWWIHNGFKCESVTRNQGHRQWMSLFHVRAPSQSCFYARRTSEASVISPGSRLRSARAILCFVYSCVYLPILILAITRMAGHVKGRFAHSQWMGQYWQHAHRISDQCKGLARTRFTGLKLHSMRRVVC